MAVPAAVVVKAAVSVLADKKSRRKAGRAVLAILSPLILVLAALCCMGQGGAGHNSAAVELSFCGGAVPSSADAAFAGHIEAMQAALSALDAAVGAVEAEGGIALDGLRIKSVFYALRFGDDPLRLSAEAARRFVDCFVEYTTVTHAETDAQTGERHEVTETVITPLCLDAAYAQLAAAGMPAADDDRKNAEHIYVLLTPAPSGGSGTYEPGGGQRIEMDVSVFVNVGEKNNRDLAAYAVQAWESSWGYVWGTFGNVLTEAAFAAGRRQYPDNVAVYADFIRTHWLGGRTTDCVGLIKGYGWLNAASMTIDYGANGMPDVSADGMYQSARIKGPLSSMPDTPGLAVWHSGHIGVYIGNGEVIEAMGTKYGVVKTRLADRNWSAWLQIPYIKYYD